MGCFVLGDSIAIGVGAVLHTECVTIAEKGIGSTVYMQRIPVLSIGDLVVLSIGANDRTDDIDMLRCIRASLKGTRVVWLMPAKPSFVRFAIGSVATEYGDKIVDTSPWVGPDGLHPTGVGYRHLASVVIK